MSENSSVSSVTYVEPPIFRARSPWWGGDLQTLRNQFVGAVKKLPSRSESMSFPVADGSGDILNGTLETPVTPPSGPLIVLIHGLTGCENSTYVRETARFHLELGRRVLRVNLRGAGTSRLTCSDYYHSGRGGDIAAVLECLDKPIVHRGIFVIGFSLGGNILINYLARQRTHPRIVGAATVSAPILPLQAAKKLMARRNTIYHSWLLNRMKKECLGLSGQLCPDETSAITNARTIYQFDNDFIAPRNGFTDAEDYYEKTAGANLVSEIAIPTLMIHAENDPWIPASPYHKLIKDSGENIEVVLAPSGGHVGFHAKGSNKTWHDRMIQKFVGGI